MNVLRTIKSVVLASSLLVLAFGATAAATPNTSTYSMSQSGNTITITETNSETIDTVGANFVYSGDTDWVNVSITPGSTFNFCPSAPSIYSLTCSVLGGVGAGSHTVAQLTFTPKDTYTAANVTVSLSASSHIMTSGTETLNASALPSATYQYTVPVQSEPVYTPAPVSTSSPAATPAPTAPVDTPVGLNSDKNGVKAAETQQTTKTKESHVGIITSSATVLVVLAAAAAYWLLIHRRSEVAPVKAYKLDAATTGSKRKPARKKPAAKQ